MSSTASTRLLGEPGYPDQSRPDRSSQAGGGLSTGLPRPEASNVTSFFGPRQQPRPEYYADVAREAGRLNSAYTTDEEFQDLLDERQGLLDKKFVGTITKKETARLELVRWELDRIEDARHGYALDHLEQLVSKYEQFGQSLQDFYAQLESHLPRKRK